MLEAVGVGALLVVAGLVADSLVLLALVHHPLCGGVALGTVCSSHFHFLLISERWC